MTTTSQKITATLKANGLNIAKRNTGQGWTTTQEAGFSSMKAGDSFRVSFYNVTQIGYTGKKYNVHSQITKAIAALEAAGFKCSYTKGENGFYAK